MLTLSPVLWWKGVLKTEAPRLKPTTKHGVVSNINVALSLDQSISVQFYVLDFLRATAYML